MKITAVAVGTRGDVNPLVELGAEMIKRGHEFRILAQEEFRPLIEKKKVTYLHLDGSAEHVMKYLVTDYKTSIDFPIRLMKLKRGSHIHVTGYWYHPEEDTAGYKEDPALECFLTEGEKAHLCGVWQSRVQTAD